MFLTWLSGGAWTIAVPVAAPGPARACSGSGVGAKRVRRRGVGSAAAAPSKHGRPVQKQRAPARGTPAQGRTPAAKPPAKATALSQVGTLPGIVLSRAHVHSSIGCKRLLSDGRRQ